MEDELGRKITAKVVTLKPKAWNYLADYCDKKSFRQKKVSHKTKTEI